MSLHDLTKCELRSRETHTSTDGVSTQRKLYIEPYGCFPDVIRLMEGRVFINGDDEWERRLPMFDPYFPHFMYCNECKVDPIDWQAMGFSPSMGFQRGDNEDQTTENLTNAIQALSSKRSPVVGQIETPEGGAYVTAHHVPLITGHADPTNPAAFDWIDPSFHLTFKTVPWPDGLNICVPREAWEVPMPATWRTRRIPDGLANPITLPIIEFSVRRLLVGQPQWNVMEGLAGAVNEDWWPGEDLVGRNSHLYHQFPPETLKFDGADVHNRVSACAYPNENHRHYEIELHYSWILRHDAPVYDKDGVAPEGLQPVTWNHVLMKPTVSWIDFAVHSWGAAWYYVSLEKNHEFMGLRSNFLRKTVGPLYSLTNFDNLHRLNPEEVD